MHQIAQQTEPVGTERMRVEAVVETLATLHSDGESLAEIAHDARNMVTALGLYCDLLDEPGVLASGFRHYGGELRLVAAASRRLVEKLVSLQTREFIRPPEGCPQQEVSLDAPNFPVPNFPVIEGRTRMCGEDSPAGPCTEVRRWDLLPAMPIDNLAAELLANRNLLSALAGPAITLRVDAEGGAVPVKITGEDLTRVLVNLVKNAAEANPSGGRIRIALRELETGNCLALTVEDSGPGIPVEALKQIFDPGYTTRAEDAEHRGLGLSITRAIVETAGGAIRAWNRNPAGACFEIQLPVRV